MMKNTLKRFMRLIMGRFFWIALILLIEFSLIVAGLVYLEIILEKDYLLYFTIVIEVLKLVTLIYIVSSDAPAQYKISWLFFVGILPLIGIVCYIMFANKRPSKHKLSKVKPLQEAIDNVQNHEQNNELDFSNLDHGEHAKLLSNYIKKESAIGITDGTSVNYYPLGDDAFPVMLEELKKAKHYIFIEYFIIAKGKMWNSMLDILVQKVKEGVDVRVMYDDVGSVATLPMNYAKTLQALGIKCIVFNKLRPLIDIKLNNRDHRKILVIDGHVGFTGGINLADEYINQEVRFGHWKDNCIKLEGKAVYGLTVLFLTLWCTLTKSNYDEVKSPKYYPETYADISHIKNDGYVQPYTDIPLDEEPLGERVYMSIVQHAKKYVYITTPYLILDDEMANCLCLKAKEGVKVVLITPHIPDKKIVFGITRSNYKKLLTAGVKIYEYTPGFVHSKMFISDDVIGTVGTINLDYRSLYLHLENGTLLYQCSCLSEMKKDFEKSMSISQEITLKDYNSWSMAKRFGWLLVRIFAPLL